MSGSKKAHGKPTGELGMAVQFPSGASFVLEELPGRKDEIEKWVLDRACLAATSYGKDPWHLAEPPRQNPERGFDFELGTSEGIEDLDLMEVVLFPGVGGYENLLPDYSVEEMARATVGRVLGKSRHYGRPTRPVHLLMYSTDWRTMLVPPVLDRLAVLLAAAEHVFRTVWYSFPNSRRGGILEPVAPRKVAEGRGEPSDHRVLIADPRSVRPFGGDGIAMRIRTPPRPSGDKDAT